MKNLRMPQFTYDTFKSAYDSDQKIQGLVNNFNERGVFFDKKTDSGAANSGDDKVSQMAKSATDLSDL